MATGVIHSMMSTIAVGAVPVLPGPIVIFRAIDQLLIVRTAQPELVAACVGALSVEWISVKVTFLLEGKGNIM
jgi:hypothetical protein